MKLNNNDHYSSLLLQKAKKFFPISFLGSISWIACFSYLMVWFAHQVTGNKTHST